MPSAPKEFGDLGITKQFTPLDEFCFALTTGTTENGMEAALAIYSGMYAYNGWAMVTFVTEEIQNPQRNIPLSVIISMSTVAVLYLCVNVAYYLALDSVQVSYSFPAYWLRS